MNMWKPNVGDKVEFNDFGLRQIGGLSSKQEIEDSRNLVITFFENIGTIKDPIYAIEVNKASINRYMLSTMDFDKKE